MGKSGVVETSAAGAVTLTVKPGDDGQKAAAIPRRTFEQAGWS